MEIEPVDLNVANPTAAAMGPGGEPLRDRVRGGRRCPNLRPLLSRPAATRSRAAPSVNAGDPQAATRSRAATSAHAGDPPPATRSKL